MWFGYHPQIIFCHIFRILNLVIFRREKYQVYVYWIMCAQLLQQF